jgi:hypothetical protein
VLADEWIHAKDPIAVGLLAAAASEVEARDDPGIGRPR